MAETIQFHDFIEIEYTGQFTDGQVFDTTNQKTAQESRIYSSQMQYGSKIICVGEKQVIAGLDQNLIGKDTSKTYTFKIPPELAFGKKDIKKIKLIPLDEFRKRKIAPQPGLQIDLDGEIGIVLRATGGRILINFNHPFAGKEVSYEVQIKRKVTDKKEQLDSFLKMAFNLPGIETKVEENKAEITLPLKLPEPLKEPIIQKLKELVKLSAVTFHTKTASQ